MSDRNFTMSYADRDRSMSLLRSAGVSDDIIGQVFGVSRQSVHKRLGARPEGEGDTPLPKVATEDLPARLAAWRARRGLSQASAARLVGISQKYGNMLWSQWETGAKSPALPGAIALLLDMYDKHEPQL